MLVSCTFSARTLSAHFIAATCRNLPQQRRPSTTSCTIHIAYNFISQGWHGGRPEFPHLPISREKEPLRCNHWVQSWLQVSTCHWQICCGYVRRKARSRVARTVEVEMGKGTQRSQGSASMAVERYFRAEWLEVEARACKSAAMDME